jgi:hypothetical protein
MRETKDYLLAKSCWLPDYETLPFSFGLQTRINRINIQCPTKHFETLSPNEMDLYEPSLINGIRGLKKIRLDIRTNRPMSV